MKRYIHRTKEDIELRKDIEFRLEQSIKLAKVSITDYILATNELRKNEEKEFLLYHLTGTYDFIYKHYELFKYNNRRNGLDKYKPILDKIKWELEK